MEAPGKEMETEVSATGGVVVAGGPGGVAAASVVTGGWKPEPEAEDGGLVSRGLLFDSPWAMGD